MSSCDDSIQASDRQTASELFSLVYWDLHQLARQWMAGERRHHTLQATALVNEAYVRLLRPEKPFHANDRKHFFAVASEAMWRILVEHARKRASLKRGGGWQRHPLDEVQLGVMPASEDILALHDVLEKLEKLDARKSRLVKLRYLVGMSLEEAAEVLEVSAATAKKDWTFAKAWLELELRPGEQTEQGVVSGNHLQEHSL